MTAKKTSCNPKTFQAFFKKAANLNTFSGVIYLSFGGHSVYETEAEVRFATVISGFLQQV